jgi:hypothetical protein
MKKIQTLTFLAVTLSYLAVPSGVQAVPVRDISNLTSITFWERTGGTAPIAFPFGM